ncbi:MAG: hypothetical protein KDC45_06160 [Bacteroidetes bacterium]|nr:hypothetical protein [Bacteroidota bacterium]
MKKTAAMAALMFLLIQSCATIKIVDDGQEIKDKKRIFYVVGGLAPITDNTAKAGEEYETKYEFIDYLISGFTGGIIYTRTIVKK